MGQTSRLLLLFLTFSICVSCCNAIKSCKKQSACSCMSDEGLIDLSPLDSGSDTVAGLSATDAQDGYTYYYNPCTPFIAYYCIQNVAGCQSSETYITGYSIGQHNTAAFEVENGQVKVTLDDGMNPAERYMEVSLKCDKQVVKDFQFVKEQPETHYKFTLTSKSACPSGGGGGGGGGLSTGSTLCIILLVVMLVYAVGGVLFNTYQRGATGKERIPNLTFWQDFPALVKDGVKFTISCGGRRGTYAEI